MTRPYGPEFVQTHVATALERVTESIFKKFPPAYSSSMANEIAEHTVLTFVTTVSLIRPMSENIRLQITQALADLELAVQQRSLHLRRPALRLPRLGSIPKATRSYEQ
jgi:hypothetical protein